LKNYFNGAPYQGPFVAGLVAAFAGALIWLGARYGWISFYPRQSHANLMYFGFLWSFIIGFLMTAGPKMTQTKGPNPFEMKVPFVAVVLQ
ncbi:MAG TPA: NnrS family protein, partial [Planctomycetaceae bacterium]|nr:NnrS family protein [Planctomycetaceae bacterium]